MKSFSRVAFCLFALVALAGCATTKVTGGQNYAGEKLARPDRIVVYEFAATAADIPAWTISADRYAAPSTQETEETIGVGRQLGAQVAAQLVEEIQSMGLPAEIAAGQVEPEIGDIAIVGYFESIDEGSAAKRVAIGFGSGGAKLTTRVEGYLMTDQGPRLLGNREIRSGGNKMPGLAVPLAVTLATANPIGLIVGGTMKVGGELTGKSKIKNSAKKTAKKIGDELRVAFQEQGWI